jgi:hypothetical protein
MASPLHPDVQPRRNPKTALDIYIVETTGRPSSWRSRDQEARMKVKLTKTVRDFSGSPYPKGSVLKAKIEPAGMIMYLAHSVSRSK